MGWPGIGRECEVQRSSELLSDSPVLGIALAAPQLLFYALVIVIDSSRLTTKLPIRPRAITPTYPIHLGPCARLLFHDFGILNTHLAPIRGSHPVPTALKGYVKRAYTKLQSRNTTTMVKDDAPDNEGSVSLAQKMMSATAGSIITSLLITPLDVVRVRLQSQSHVSTTSSSSLTNPRAYTVGSLSHFRDLPPSLGISTCCREVFWINNHAPFCVAGPTLAPLNPVDTSCAVREVERRAINGTWDGLRKIAQNEGPRTLWRGLSPTLVMAVPANVIYFAGYDWLRTAQQSPFRTMVSDAYIPLVAGASARVLAAVAVSPIEMFRTRMQAASHTATAAGHFRETLDGIREMVASQGIPSLWRGLTLTLWRDVPFSALYWWGYEFGRNALTDMRGGIEARNNGDEFRVGRGEERRHRRSRSRSQEKNTSTLVDSFIAGAGSGAVAAFVTTPFDVGKTRQQVIRHAGDSAESFVKAVRPENLSMPRFLWHIFQEQGTSGLFKGWAARCLKVAPACAIMISSYEVGKKMATNINERRREDD